LAITDQGKIVILRHFLEKQVCRTYGILPYTKYAYII